jgi:hypothetical protein
MTFTDTQLLDTYWKGWNDCPDSVSHEDKYIGLSKKAYRIGWMDHIIGNDVTSNTYQTEEEILKNIKE